MCQNKICLIYQYILFKGDRLNREKQIALSNLRNYKSLSSSDFIRIYSTIAKAEAFDEFFDDLYDLLK